MNNGDILSALKTEKTDLETQVRGAAARIAQLSAAIDALEGRAVPAARNGHRGVKSVREMLLDAAVAIGSGRTFDQKGLAERAATLYPAEAAKLRRGVYGSIAGLIGKKKINRCPGGFQLA